MKYLDLIKNYEFSYRKFVKIKGLRIKSKLKYQKTNNVNKFYVHKKFKNYFQFV